MTTLPETQDDAQRLAPLPPSPWSVPRPDGPLAAALRLAQERRGSPEPLDLAHEGCAQVGIDLPPDLQPLPPPSHPSPEAMQDEIDAIAREARARDDVREALAIALEWPQDAGDTADSRRARAWIGWATLAGALAVACAAAVIAMALGRKDSPPQPRADGLKMERQLSLSRGLGSGAGP